MTLTTDIQQAPTPQSAPSPAARAIDEAGYALVP